MSRRQVTECTREKEVSKSTDRWDRAFTDNKVFNKALIPITKADR